MCNRNVPDMVTAACCGCIGCSVAKREKSVPVLVSYPQLGGNLGSGKLYIRSKTEVKVSVGKEI